MANWLASREAVKLAGAIDGSTQNARIDRIIASVSRDIELLTQRFYIPRTETRLYRWPPLFSSLAYRLWLDQDLRSITTLQAKAQDASPTTIAAADYFLEPKNTGPPYNRIEIDLSSSSAFAPGATVQRSISVAGVWGYSADTEPAGTVSSGLASDAAATSMVCSDGSKVDVGDTLLIQSEQVFVSARASAALGTILLNGALTASKAGVTVTVDASHGISAGEVILVGSERMYVEEVSGNNLTVIRAYDGSVLASHADDTAVHVYRTLTIERGVNGTTAATHANATAISRYLPPQDIRSLAVGWALHVYAQETGQWGRVVGTGEGAREYGGRSFNTYKAEMIDLYRRWNEAAV